MNTKTKKCPSFATLLYTGNCVFKLARTQRLYNLQYQESTLKQRQIYTRNEKQKFSEAKSLYHDEYCFYTYNIIIIVYYCNIKSFRSMVVKYILVVRIKYE